jgi:hypothetical protein
VTAAGGYVYAFLVAFGMVVTLLLAIIADVMRRRNQ